ncbi:MAG: tetratricopeptide repeat protein [Bacteroidales bacterium]|jgi:tetratricopeptide (TPR) repeat protein|nr:tetratricopeptide repeat protein [Bacteroidales bacterium]
MKRIELFTVFLFCMFSVFSQSNNEQLAYEYHRNHEYEKAKELFAELYRQKPTHHFYTFYFHTLLQLGDTKEAERLVKKQINQIPSIQRYNVDLGHVYEMQGDYAKAKKQYESCITNITVNSNIVVEIAQAFLSYKLNDYAIRTYLHGRKLSNQSSAYTGEITSLYENMDNHEKAMTEYILLLGENENTLNFVASRLTNWLIDDNNDTHSEIIREQLLKAITKYPDNKAYSSLMIWFSMQKKDFVSAMKQAKAMDKRYNETGQRILELSTVAAKNYDFNTAIDGYNYIITKGEASPLYYDAQIMLVNIKLTQVMVTYPVNYEQVNYVDKELTQYFQSRTVNKNTFDVYRRWISLKAIQLNDISTATKMINELLSSNNIQAKEKALLKLDLGDILRLEGDVWEATLLYSQVEKDFPNDTIRDLAKFKNAKLSFHIGEFEWAKSQLDVLRSATSKLIANDAMYFSLLISDNQNEDDSVNNSLKQFAIADFLMEVHHYKEALILLDSIEHQNLYHSLSDDVLYKKAKIATIQQNYIKADSLYETLLSSYPYDLLADEALFERAKLQETHLNNKLKAMELYQQLLHDYPNSIYIIDARKQYRILRGDILKMTN